MLVLRPGALGDTLLAVPALRALRRAGMQVTFAANGAAADFLRSVSEVDRALAFDDPSLGWLFTGPPRDEMAVAWMSESPRGLPAGALLAPSRPPGMDRHCARYLLETLAPLGIDVSWDDRPLRMNAASRDEVLVHAGSGSAVKNWPAEDFAAVIHALDCPVRLVVGEADEGPVARLEECLGRRLPRLEQPSLADLAARLAGCHAYLGNDSGVSHLAGLCGARAVVMFGPTDPNVWRPIGPNVTALAFDTPTSEVARGLEKD